MSFSASQVSNREPAGRRRSARHARWTRLGVDLWRPRRPKASCADARRPAHGPQRAKLGDRNVVVVTTTYKTFL
jgi:hypothetical protein